MEVHSAWYDRVAREIHLYRDSLSKKEIKKYKLDLLLRVASRVADFSPTCGECQLLQQDITRLVQDLGNLVQIPDKEQRKSYFNMIKSIIKHLQKQHKLVTEGQYMGIGVVIGVGIGAALGAALDSPGAGTGIGTVIGILIGNYLDKKAKKEGRVI